MSEPIPYATPLPARSNHDVIYTVLLGAGTFFMLIGTLTMGFLAYRAPQPAESVWVLQIVFYIYLSLVVLAAAVLIVRIAMPARRKWITMTLNLVLLLFIPFGTALGIYGLWKVDKNVAQ